MKMMLKYCLTNVRERKARTAVMLLSIVLSATLLFVSFSIGVSYESAQRKMARGLGWQRHGGRDRGGRRHKPGGDSRAVVRGRGPRVSGREARSITKMDIMRVSI